MFKIKQVYFIFTNNKTIYLASILLFVYGHNLSAWIRIVNIKIIYIQKYQNPMKIINGKYLGKWQNPELKPIE